MTTPTIPCYPNPYSRQAVADANAGIEAAAAALRQRELAVADPADFTDCPVCDEAIDLNDDDQNQNFIPYTPTVNGVPENGEVLVCQDCATLPYFTETAA